MSERTLGNLTAADLGSRVTVEDGGSTHAGELRTVHHNRYDERTTTMVGLVSGEWRHTKTYPSDLVCVVEAPADDGSRS